MLSRAEIIVSEDLSQHEDMFSENAQLAQLEVSEVEKQMAGTLKELRRQRL